MKLKLTEDQYGRLFEQDNTKMYKALKNIFERRFDLSFPYCKGTSYEYDTLIKDKTTDISYSEYELDGTTWPIDDLVEIISDLTGYDDRLIAEFLNNYIQNKFNEKLKDEDEGYYSYTKLNEEEFLNDKTYQVIKKIFERNFSVEFIMDDGDGYSSSEYNLNEFYDELGDLTGFNWKTIQAFYNAYLKDESANNISRVVLEQTDKSYNILKKYFNRHFDLMRDEYGTYVLYKDKEDEEDSTDYKFYVDEEGWYGVLADIKADTGFDKDTIENFIISYSDELYRNEEEGLYEEVSDNKVKQLLIKLINKKYRSKKIIRNFVLYDKENGYEVSLNDIVSYLARVTGYQWQYVFNLTKDFIDNKTNFLAEEIKINRTPNLLNIKIIEDKENIGEITFESEDGIEYTIIDAEIKPEFRNKGFYKKAIIDILKKYPDIKIVSIFRSDDADKAWNSLIEKLPPEFKIEKTEHEAEKTKEYKLSLNEELDSDKRSKIIIKYLLQDFEPVMAIDPYKFTEKVIFFYKDDAEREEDYELYLWDNQSFMPTIVSILSNVTGYDRNIIYDVVQKYIKDVNKHGLKSINEAEIDADGNLVDFDYEEETDAEFETSNFSFILDKIENGEVYGDFTFKKIDLRFPIVMKPEGDTYRIGFPDDNIEQDFMGAANHFRLGKEYNQFIRHILNTLLK